MYLVDRVYSYDLVDQGYTVDRVYDLSTSDMGKVDRKYAANQGGLDGS
jgi:hypothetical protein